RANRTHAMNNMHQLGAGFMTYVSQHDQTLPPEDSKGTDTWQNAAKPENADVGYNSIPKILGLKGVGDYATSTRDFYTKPNILFLPGATYPETDKKLRQPLFAMAVNTKLQRKDPEGKRGDPGAKKEPVKVTNVTNPVKT